MAQSIHGKVAFITGAGKGIGRETALHLAREGVKVGLISRTAGDLEQTAREVEEAGGQAAFATADVSSLTEVEAAVAELTDKLGTADILVNNAGIAKFGGFLDLDPKEWTRIIEVNLLGAYYVTRAVLPQLIEKNAGDIINISSTAGQKGGPVMSAYSASKFGLLGLTESLAAEVRKHNIRVSALTPSTVATELAFKENLTDGNPEKVLQPEDLAEFIVDQLKLNPRVFVKSAGLWSTNP